MDPALRARPREVPSEASPAPAVTSSAPIGFEYSLVDYKGRSYADFYVRRAPASGPGWYVFGRNPEYGNTLIRLCARPAVKPRAHRHYNVSVRRGWRTRREAQAAADLLNLQFPAQAPRTPAA